MFNLFIYDAGYKKYVKSHAPYCVEFTEYKDLAAKFYTVPSLLQFCCSEPVAVKKWYVKFKFTHGDLSKDGYTANYYWNGGNTGGAQDTKYAKTFDTREEALAGLVDCYTKDPRNFDFNVVEE